MGMGDKETHYQFADLDWQSRWNTPDAPHFMLSQSGPSVMATGLMGVLRFRLDKDEDVTAIVAQLRLMADGIEQAKREYDGVCDRCGGAPAPHWSSEICQRCDPVLLCATCFELHKHEVAADKADGLA
jgi:hypothetical protein